MTTPTPSQVAPNEGAALKVLRIGANLTLEDLAGRVEISKSTLSRFENGQRLISADLRYRLTRAIADALLEQRAA